MKTHTIKTPTAELMIVELPEKYDLEWMNDEKYIRAIIDSRNHIEERLGNPPVSYTLLGKPEEIGEEDARELVESFGRCKLKRFKGYGKKQFEKTAKESLLSLIESEIYWANPYREKVFVNMDISASMVRAANREIYSEKWHEAEQKTFDRSRSIILARQ